MGLFSRKKWEKLGNAWTGLAVGGQLGELSPIILDLRDIDYRAIPLSDFMALMRKFRRQETWYRKEIFDCDDYAICFMADIKRGWAEVSLGNDSLAFGYISAVNPDGVMHAFIWQLDDQGSINFIEPQTDTIISWRPIGVKCIEA